MRNKIAKKLKHRPYNKLKGLLAERELNQKYLARLLGISPVTVNQKINGTLEFTYTEIETICDDLEVSTELFRGQKVS
jgi:DNA-binding Xre family transcriptional regulator